MLFASPVFAQKNNNPSFRWEIANELPAGNGQAVSLGVAGPVTGVYNKYFIVAGGANFPAGMPWEGGAKKYDDRICLYSQERRQLKLKTTEYTLPQPVAYAASGSIDDGLIYAGGENAAGITGKVWLLSIDKDGIIRFDSLPSLPIPVSNAAMTIVDNTAYLAGGENSSQTFNQLLTLDLSDSNSGWKKLADIPQPVSHAVLIAVKNKTGVTLYLSGGRKKNSSGISTLYNHFWAYSASTNNWQEKPPLPYVLCAGTGLQTDEHTILLFGGDKGTVFNKVETLIAAIQKEQDPEKKQALTLEKNKLQSTHPGFSREILRFDLKKETWSIAGQLPFETPVTTTAVKGKYSILIPSGEIKAGVRTPNILSLKIRR